MNLAESFKASIIQLRGWAEDLLNVKGQNLIGINIGQSSVKISEVIREPKEKKIQLIRYSSHPLSEGTVIEHEIHNEEDLVQAIQNAMKVGYFSTKNAAIGIAGSHVVVKRLKLAGGTPDEIESQVFWEAEHYIPFNLDSAFLSYHVITNNDTEGCDIIIAAATKEFTNTIKNIVERAGVKVKSITPDSLAIANVFEYVYADQIFDSHHSYLVLNIGGQKTDIIVYSHNGVSFTKEINYGGLMVTEEIQRRMGVTYEEAEDLKTTRDENNNLPEEIQIIVDEVIDIFLDEIKKTIEFYIKTTSDEKFHSCYITGGAAQTPGLRDSLEDLLGLDVLDLNPFDKIVIQEKGLSNEQRHPLSSQVVTSIGLSMGGLNND